MGKDKASNDYVQRELEEPVQKVVDDKMNDPFIATKKGERDATEVLQEGVAKSLKEKQIPTPDGTQTSRPSQDLKEKAAEGVGSMSEKAADTVRDVADQVGQVAGRVAEQAREVGGKVQDASGNFKGVVDKSLNDQPMAALAVAALLGFVLGVIWKS
jgi:ElaB/YqjD/DUF883 family membrane-anchored ribosome-binding protein